MRKLRLLFFFLLPIVASAQLDKIKLGMSLADLKKEFPSLKPDVSAMSSQVYTNDSINGIKGLVIYQVSRDTLSSYDFQSSILKGPCAEYPDVDSTKYSNLFKTAYKLYDQYNLLYGKAFYFFTRSRLVKDSNDIPVTIFIAKWKKGNDLLSVELSHSGTKGRYVMNSPPPTDEEMKPGCNYMLEVLSIGTDKAFKGAFGNGMNGSEFKKLHPLLASQMTAQLDSWRMDDTLTNMHGYWGVSFMGGALDSYGLDVYGGPEYSGKSDSSYLLLKKRTLQLFAEAEKLYGKPDSSSYAMPGKYKQEERKIYHSTTYFSAEWKLNNKKLYILFDKREGGKQFNPIFNLRVYCGNPILEE